MDIGEPGMWVAGVYTTGIKRFRPRQWVIKQIIFGGRGKL